MNPYKLFLRLCALLLGGAGILLATSCAGSHSLTTDRTTEAPLPFASEGGITPADTLHMRPDSTKLVVVVPHRSLLDKVFGRKPQPRAYAAGTYIGSVGKKATIYYGPATVSGKKATVAAGEGAAAVSGKKAGPVVKADSGASLNYATTGRGQAAAGEGITQENTEAKPPTLLERTKSVVAVIGTVAVAGGLLWLLASGAVAVAGTGPAWLLPYLWKRKSSSQA